MRRSGRTTRLIDEAVQALFNNGSVVVYDHHPTKRADERLFEMLLERLSREHEINKTNSTIDRNTFSITLT